MKNLHIEFRHETEVLSQKEIDGLLITKNGSIKHLLWKIKQLREWKLVIRIKYVEYKISFCRIEKVDYNPLYKSLDRLEIMLNKTYSLYKEFEDREYDSKVEVRSFTEEEIDEITEAGVLSKEDIDRLLTAKEDEKSK